MVFWSCVVRPDSPPDAATKNRIPLSLFLHCCHLFFVSFPFVISSSSTLVTCFVLSLRQFCLGSYFSSSTSIFHLSSIPSIFYLPSILCFIYLPFHPSVIHLSSIHSVFHLSSIPSISYLSSIFHSIYLPSVYLPSVLYFIYLLSVFHSIYLLSYIYLRCSFSFLPRPQLLSPLFLALTPLSYLLPPFPAL